MRFSELISRMNNLTSNEEVALYYKALRQNPVIWEGVTALEANDPRILVLSREKQPLNAGTLAVAAYNPDIDFHVLADASFPHELLEKVMLGYEEYSLSDTPVDSIEKTGQIALALYAKAKNVGSWMDIFQEILARGHFVNFEQFENFWLPILIAAINLVEDKNSFLEDLMAVSQPQLVLNSLIRLVLSLPIADESKTDLLKKRLNPLDEQTQVTALRSLKQAGGTEISTLVAKYLLEKYRDLDLSDKTTRDYWNDPLSSTKLAFQCQAVADIALLAEDGDTALLLNEKALSILSALVKKGKVKKAGISTNNQAGIAFKEIFAGDELNDPDIQAELVYSQIDDDTPLDGLVHPLKTIQQSRKLIEAGNRELAREEVHATIENLSDRELERILIEGSDQIQTWDPEKLIQPLEEIGAHEAVQRFTRILLTENPNSLVANLAAAKSAEALGDIRSAIRNWEALTLLQPDSAVVKRNLAEAYKMDGNIESAFAAYKELTVGKNDANKADLQEFAELALQVGKPDETLAVGGRLLDLEPENTRVLTLIGMAYGKTGNLPAAEEKLRQAITYSEGDDRPWLELAELKWREEKREESIATLKEGLAANPGARAIKADLSKKMMHEGLVSESYPILAELSSKGVDLENDLLLVQAMETLGMEGIPEMLQTMVERYPQDSRFLGDYGKRLVWGGDAKKGLEFLERLGDDIYKDMDWTLAYLEARHKPDYSELAFVKKYTEDEIQDLSRFLDKYLDTTPEDQNARLLKGELLLFSGEKELAFQHFSELNRENDPKSAVNTARLLTGFSIAAADCGELEIARVALEKAISQEPEWYALQAEKARLLYLVGDTSAAYKQVTKALQQAPRSAENQVWAVRFLQQVGNDVAASNLLTESINQYPDHLGLNLLAAERTLSDTNNNDLDKDHLFSLLQRNPEPENLVRGAVVFAQHEDPDQILWCLEKAAELDSEKAKFYLAGLHRINQDYAGTIRNLENIKSHQPLVKLLKAETLFSSGQTEGLELPYSEIFSRQTETEFDEAFLPGEWKEILQSSRPAISLGLKFALLNGNYEKVLEAVHDWIEKEPENIEARIFGIETALAAGDKQLYDRLTESMTEGALSESSSLWKLLISERKFNVGEGIDEPSESFDLFESINSDEPEKIAVIREMRRSGRVSEAETTFEMSMGVYYNLEEEPLIYRLSILRNLAKCAFELDRWSEAFSIINRALKFAPASENFNILRVQATALALEFNHRAENLKVVSHGGSDLEKIAQELSSHQDEIKVSSAGWDLDHWMKRLRLAYEPNKENIRELAKLSPSPEDAAAMVSGLRRNGQIETALLVGKKYTNSPTVLYEIALCAEGQQLELALDMLSKLLDIDPHQPLALRLMSVLLERKLAFNEALSHMESALELWPNETAWHVDAAALWKRLGNIERPVEHLQIACTYNPNDVEIRRLLGGAFLSAGNMNEALPHLVAVVEKNTEDYDSWIALSQLYQSTGDLDLAIQAAGRASEVNPAGVLARLQAARISWAKGEIKKAFDHANRALNLDPQDPAAYVFLARLSKEQGDNAKALELLEKAAAVNPASLNTVIEHANLVKEINGVVAARDLIASFSAKFPENPDLLILLADAEDQCGDNRNAESAAKKALEINPEERSIHMLMGRIVEKNGNLDQAAQYYSQAVSLDPVLLDGYLRLSQVYIKQREFSKARKVLEHGIEKIPGNVELYLSCALLLKEAKDYRAAEQMLRKASHLEPRNVSIHRQLGAILALNMVHQSQEVGSQV